MIRAPFFGKDGKRLNPTALKSNVLCTRHNQALSPLDELARKFFAFALGQVRHQFLIIQGRELERWMLKLMCGLIATGPGQTPSGAIIAGTEPPLPALETLFGSLPLPEQWGLVIPQKSGRGFQDKVSIFVLDDQGRACGCTVQFAFVELMFFLRAIPTLPDQTIRLHHRPSSLGLSMDDSYREIHFGWPDGEHVVLVLTTNKPAAALSATNGSCADPPEPARGGEPLATQGQLSDKAARLTKNSPGD
ncbi:MAG TPA: hypothetical protein VJS92_08790 [Candidatus Polarisedimenticolaceae bacterium]|nr:hypothetical protein [Candidatus Polarisedimenticolaceae bacterium]